MRKMRPGEEAERGAPSTFAGAGVEADPETDSEDFFRAGTAASVAAGPLLEIEGETSRG